MRCPDIMRNVSTPTQKHSRRLDKLVRYSGRQSRKLDSMSQTHPHRITEHPGNYTDNSDTRTCSPDSRTYCEDTFLGVRRLNLRTHLQTLCLRRCLENLFCHKLLVNQWKMTNQLQTTGSSVKIVGEIGKSFCEHGREQKFRRTVYPLNYEHFLCSSKNWLETVCKQTFCKPRTNHTNIVL